MTTWLYEGRNRQGQEVSGTHQAPDRAQALAFLRAQGLFLTRLDPQSPRAKSAVAAANATSGAASAVVNSTSGIAMPVAERVADARPASAPQKPSHGASASPPLPRQPLLRASHGQLATFYSQMASLLHAGTSLGAAFDSLSKYAEAPALANAAGQLADASSNGTPPSRAMAAFPGLFSPLALGIVEAGERGGFLEASFRRLSETETRAYQIEQEIKKRTWYPKLLIFCSILIPGAVPLFLSGFGAFLQQVGPPILFLLIVWALVKALVFFGPAVTTFAPITRVWDGFKLLVPWVSKVTRQIAAARFCRALAALSSAGVAPGRAVRLSARASGNEVIAARAMAVAPRLDAGESLVACLESVGGFHPLALRMIAVGEESGALDEQLDKAAEFLEGNATTAIDQALPVLGIVVFLGVAVYVGSQVISSYAGNVTDLLNEAENLGS